MLTVTLTKLSPLPACIHLNTAHESTHVFLVYPNQGKRSSIEQAKVTTLWPWTRPPSPPYITRPGPCIKGILEMFSFSPPAVVLQVCTSFEIQTVWSSPDLLGRSGGRAMGLCFKGPLGGRAYERTTVLSCNFLVDSCQGGRVVFYNVEKM